MTRNRRRVLFGAAALLLLLAGAAALRWPRADRVPLVESPSGAIPLSLPPRMNLSRGFYLNDRFSMAPTEWRVAGDVNLNNGSITNRWECDPRYSFFTLTNDRKLGKRAVLWSKRSLTGDLSVEFFFGIKQDHKYGNPYSYARDVNLTICSDGSDLTKGYTFCFGGMNNTCSCIMRDGVIVRQLPVKIPTALDYTRHWFRFSVERTGNTVSFGVDHFFSSPTSKTSRMEFEDPEPLSGDRIAIWIYDCPISVSRITLSGDGEGAMEPPDFLPGRLVTMYDNELRTKN